MDGKVQVTQVTAFPAAVLVETDSQVKTHSIFKVLDCGFEQWLYAYIQHKNHIKGWTSIDFINHQVTLIHHPQVILIFPALDYFYKLLM